MLPVLLLNTNIYIYILYVVFEKSKKKSVFVIPNNTYQVGIITEILWGASRLGGPTYVLVEANNPVKPACHASTKSYLVPIYLSHYE